jgi:hypothetical protein
MRELHEAERISRPGFATQTYLNCISFEDYEKPFFFDKGSFSANGGQAARPAAFTC